LEPRAWVKNITFSDNTTIAFEPDDAVIIVGPNNSGKSATLRAVRDKFANSNTTSPVVKGIVVQREGTFDDLIEWLGRTSKRMDSSDPANPTFQSFGAGISVSSARAWWNQGNQLHDLSRFFCHMLTADERLQAANPPTNISLIRDAPQHPIHFLQRDDILEKRLSEEFSRAFDMDFVVHRNAGNTVPIHIGTRPEPAPGQDRVSLGYVTELEKLPALHAQGDGMRSFGGVLLFTAVGHHTVLLVDEPEAFLHPPQARHLGRVLVTYKSGGSAISALGKQLFLATHSGDVLRGALDAESKRVRVLRLRRSGDANVTRELNNAEITRVWSDPLLRYSNILDGLFHEKVVVAEADGDCRFYAAIMDAMFETASNAGRKRDVMFTHCGGKDRLPLVVRSLRGLEVPVAVVVDFDVLSSEQTLRNIVEASGGDWNAVLHDWREVKHSIDSKKPELSSDEVRKDIHDTLRNVVDPIFPATAKRRIQEVLRRSSPWSTAKTVGVHFVPNGQPSQACSRLLAILETMRIFVVPVGQLEGFCKTVGDHGPGWVAEALKKDLGRDPELEGARRFVARVTA
jgi:hypothetical protein